MKNCIKAVAVLLLGAVSVFGATFGLATTAIAPYDEPSTTGSVILTELISSMGEQPQKITIKEMTKEETTTYIVVEEETDTTNATVNALTTIPQKKDNTPSDKILLGQFKLTAYCPCSKCNGKWAGGITSTGAKAKANHTIAVDPKVIPYGTVVLINGQSYTAEDCGGAIKGNKIDIFFDTHTEASNFGVQYAEVYLVVE